MSTLVYLAPLIPPYLTLDFQKDTFNRWLNKNNITEYRYEKELSNIDDYQSLVIYSVAALGDTLQEIIKMIKTLTDKGVKIYAITDPIDFQNFGNDPEQNMLLSTCIGYALYQNKFWKNI